MTPAVKLTLFALALGALFLVGLGIGRAVGPL